MNHNQNHCAFHSGRAHIRSLSELQIQPHLFQIGEGLDALWLVIRLLEARDDREATSLRALLKSVHGQMQNSLNEVYECISL